MKSEQEQRHNHLDVLTNLPISSSSPNTGKGNITRGAVPQKSVRGGGGTGGGTGGKAFFASSSLDLLASKSIEVAAVGEKEELIANASPLISPVSINTTGNANSSNSSSGNAAGNRNSGMFSRLLGQR